MACIPKHNVEFPTKIITLQKNYSHVKCYSLTCELLRCQMLCYGTIFQSLDFKPHKTGEEDTLLRENYETLASDAYRRHIMEYL